MTDSSTVLPASIAPEPRTLTTFEFQQLADIPPELEWLANIESEKTAKAYRRDVVEFFSFVGIQAVGEIRIVARSHIISWRDELKSLNKSDATIRRKLSALSSLFEFLCDKNAVSHNPVDGVKRPASHGSSEGKTPAISEAQARELLNAPSPETLKGKRDRAILATLLYHGLRREELVQLRVRDYEARQGIFHFHVVGKRKKVRYIPVSPIAQYLLAEYFDALGHRDDLDSALFRPVQNNVTGVLNKHLHPESVLEIVLQYARKVGITVDTHGFCVHSLRATAATNALDHGAEISKVQQWLGHSNIATTRLYDKRGMKIEESPTFKVQY